MDIIVVRQPDDSYKTSPFRIRFGSFRVLKAKEKIVNILVNGHKTEITMRLSECGEAYFMNEIISRPIEDKGGYISDGYSPVETGNSAPSSPLKKINPLESKKFDAIEKLCLDGDTVIEPEVDQLSVVNSTLTDIKANLTDKFEIQSLAANSEFLMDPYELEEKRNRKMSFDVMSRDENFYKFRLSRQTNFTIESTMKSRNNMRVEMSNSWNLISKGKDNLEEIFIQNKISKEEFFKDPWKVLNNYNLAFRYEDNVYTWKVIAPIIFAQLAYNEDLPTNVMSSLTQSQQGFFLWRKTNMDAFKIDIKKTFEKIEKDKNLNLTQPQIPIQEINNEVLSSDKSPRKVAINSAIASEKSTESSPCKESYKDNKPHVPEVEARRHSIQYRKTYTLSSDQIKSLNLKPGKNEISFVVSSKIQGTQILTTDIYLWDWEDKIVISDLDGTITRSDVLGHFLPYIGKDWSHKGVVKLFNEIAKNGYKIIYLTARSISQSDATKNYLKNKLNQSKKYLIFKICF
jgi:phosphatidate phosphatase PAH1